MCNFILGLLIGFIWGACYKNKLNVEISVEE